MDIDPAIDRIIHHPDEIARRVDEIAQEIRRDYAGRDLTFIVLIKGAAVFASDLARKLPFRIEIEFISASSYGSDTVSSRDPSITDAIRSDLSGKHLLIIEDIVDTGHTIVNVIKFLKKKNPANIALCAFLDKPSRREVEVKIDYAGFSVPDVFVVGYGLDFAQQFRNLPYIGVVKDEFIKRMSGS